MRKDNIKLVNKDGLKINEDIRGNKNNNWKKHIFAGLRRYIYLLYFFLILTIFLYIINY